VEDLCARIEAWAAVRVLVAGDYMLDRSMFGHADRLSPDAPVPVLAIEREESNAGGAANVCFALAALGCRPVCLGVTGDDAAGIELRRHLDQAGCRTEGLLRAEDRPTIVKQSFIGLAQHRAPQKMFRADYEKVLPIPAELQKALLEHAQAALPEIDVICIEDHGKGLITESFCQELIALARTRNLPVLVDPPLRPDFALYRGATLIKPNRFEAATAVGRVQDVQRESAWVEIAEALLEDLECQAVVMTLDRQGALLLERGGEPLHLPTTERSVYDVTGAGDIVFATLAGAIGNGVSLPSAVRLANVAAGLEVERFGVVPIRLEELHLALLRQERERSGKRQPLAQLLPELSAYRKLGRTVAFTNGCFDILHAGHVDLLRRAKETADLLVLALNSDVSIRALKGPSRPIVPEADRVSVLSALECVDYIVVFGDGSGGHGDTPLGLIEAIRPDVLVKGGDYTRETIVGADIVTANGGRIVTIPLVEGRSTTGIVERIRSGD
jgi:D-beta-D-heptose 7-phosphate kinase / D-beta-D-heptose 1-phosphate adenosyltransferase